MFRTSSIKQIVCFHFPTCHLTVRTVYHRENTCVVSPLCGSSCAFLSQLTVQTVYHNTVQQTLSQTWSNPSRRSGRVQMHISGNGSSGDVQNDWTKMSWVESQKVGCYNWLHEGVWFQSHTTQFGTPSNPAVSNMITSTLWKDCPKTKKIL